MALSTRKVPVLGSGPAIGLGKLIPGTLPANRAGANWLTQIRTRTLGTVEWQVIDARDMPRGDWTTLTDPLLMSAAGVPLAVPFVATGDFLRVRAPGNDAVSAQSTRVRLLPAGPNEPPVPAGWAVSFYDDFPGLRLNRGNWRIVSGGPGFDAKLVTIADDLVLQMTRRNGAYLASGLQISNSSFGGLSWDDLQVSVRCRFDRGQGVGARVALVPWKTGVTLPRLDLVQTPGKDKTTLRSVNYWVGGASGSPANYPLNLTQWHVITARRSSGRWNLWIDGQEQAVPTAWAQHAYRDRLTLALATTTLPAADGAPDSTTPGLFGAYFSYVRISAPA